MSSGNISYWFRKAILPLLIASTGTISTPASAQSKYMPNPMEIVTPEEQPVLEEISERLTAGDPKGFEPFVEAQLLKLKEPTKFRGWVQMLRASALASDIYTQGGDDTKAREAIEESIRLLPDYSGPLIEAAWLANYSDQPARGADYLMRALKADPEAVMHIDDYDLNGLLRRLNVIRDERRTRLLSEALLKAHWQGTGISGQSKLARSVIEMKMSGRDSAGAKSFISKVSDPRDGRSLLIMNDIKPIWGDIERWTGPRLEKQWLSHLREIRARWETSKDAETVVDYANALNAAGYDKTLIRDVMPILLGKITIPDDYDMVFALPPLLRALGREGRWDDGAKVLAHCAKIWPLGRSAIDMNVAIQQAVFTLHQGKFALALKQLDAVLLDARTWGPQVNSDALSGLHAYRARALHELGRDSEMGPSILFVRSVSLPTIVAELFQYTGRPDEARKVLIEGLTRPTERLAILTYLQPQRDRALPNEYGKRINALDKQLRTDPAIFAEASKYGRILPFRLDEGAPPESQFNSGFFGTPETTPAKPLPTT